MQTRLTDRCPGSHLSSFATKAATNAAPSNRALALPFSSVRALEQFHARAREDSLFTVCSTVCEISAVKPRNSTQRGANALSQDTWRGQCSALHTATLLPNGKVLVAAGVSGVQLSSAELYDPASGTWSDTNNLTNARELHTATLLSNGKVLVAGGLNSSPLSSTELYDIGLGFMRPDWQPQSRAEDKLKRRMT